MTEPLRTVDLESIQVLPYDVHGNNLGKWFVHWKTSWADVQSCDTRAHSRGEFRSRRSAERAMNKMLEALS